MYLQIIIVLAQCLFSLYSLAKKECEGRATIIQDKFIFFTWSTYYPITALCYKTEYTTETHCSYTKSLGCNCQISQMIIQNVFYPEDVWTLSYIILSSKFFTTRS